MVPAHALTFARFCSQMKLDIFPRFVDSTFYKELVDLKFEDRKVVTIVDFDIYRFLGAGGFGMVLLAEKVSTSHNNSHLTSSRHNGN